MNMARPTAILLAGALGSGLLLAAAATPATAQPATATAARAASVQDLRVVSVSPSPGTYGSGILVKVRFDRAVPMAARKAATAKVRVSATKPLGRTGWAWTDAQTAVFRPEKFWPGHAKVTIAAKPDSTVLPGGTLRWAGTVKRSFSIGRQQVIKVDSKTHRAKVVRDGKVIRTMPVSLGKAGWETRSGVKVMTEKYRVKTMTGASIGAEDYTLQVPYAIRLTNSGEFIHAAPWAASRIGRWNGSHGCTNLLTTDAKWLFSNSMVGDPVVTTGTKRPMETWNGAGGPWNTPWKTWLEGYAT